ncbi:hypothetical protein D6D17_07111 [Aureobasidium pullulans]|nr:hypothetical protein D6D17_07111 [Aureobasidium pullulans]
MACRSQKGGETSGAIRVSEVGSAFVTAFFTGIPGAVRTVEMHNVSNIGLFILRKRLTIVLSVEATSNSAKIMHFYSYECDRV